MNVLTKKSVKVLLLTLSCLGCFTASNVMAEEEVKKGNKFYVGLSGGFTHVQPRVTTPNGTVTDNKSAGYKLVFGRELKNNYSIEAFYADLGEASIDTGVADSVPLTTVPQDLRTGDVSYKVYGVAVKKTIPVKRVKNLSLVGKLGISDIKNSINSRVTYRQVDPWDLYAAIGAEYKINEKVAAYAEFDYYDSDANFLGFGIKVKLK